MSTDGSGGLPIWEVPQRAGPWDRPGTFYFYGGDLSSFALTPGLRLPGGWYGHPRPAQRVDVLSAEHYFQACKAARVAPTERAAGGSPCGRTGSRSSTG
jgi:hypothetical protein